MNGEATRVVRLGGCRARAVLRSAPCNGACGPHGEVGCFSGRQSPRTKPIRATFNQAAVNGATNEAQQ